MKTLLDYLKVICEGDYSSPLYIMPKSMYGLPHLTTCGRMLYIGVDMLMRDEY